MSSRAERATRRQEVKNALEEHKIRRLTNLEYGAACNEIEARHKAIRAANRAQRKEENAGRKAAAIHRNKSSIAHYQNKIRELNEEIAIRERDKADFTEQRNRYEEGTIEYNEFNKEIIRVDKLIKKNLTDIAKKEQEIAKLSNIIIQQEREQNPGGGAGGHEGGSRTRHRRSRRRRAATRRRRMH